MDVPVLSWLPALNWSSKSLLLVTGPPRSGISLSAAQLAAHPDAILLDGNQSLGWVWLKSQLTGSTLLDKQRKQIEKDLHEINGFKLIQHARHVIVPVQQLIFEQDVKNQLIKSDLARQCQLIVLKRNKLDTVCSLARFPHLYPDLPSPHLDRPAFLAAADELVMQSISELATLTGEWTSAGLPYQEIQFEALADLSASSTELHGRFGMRELKSRDQLQFCGGISTSLCFRERQIDGSSINRWHRQLPPIEPSLQCQSLSPDETCILNMVHLSEPENAPIILTGRGGSGTRLLAETFRGMDVDLGQSLNRSLDSLQWADLIYEMVLANLAGHSGPWSGTWAAELKQRARWHSPQRSRPEQPWGFKLPEAIMVCQELMEAWPTARLVHLVRHPLDVCLRRTHMTSRTSNPIGRATLQAAYQALDRNLDPDTDPPHWRNAVSWWFQLSRMQGYKDRYADRIIEVRYEDLCDNTRSTADKLALDLQLKAGNVQLEVNSTRRRRWQPTDPHAKEIWDLCEPIASIYGYTLVD